MTGVEGATTLPWELLRARKRLAEKHGRRLHRRHRRGRLQNGAARNRWRGGDFVDPATDGPLPGREEDWSLVSEYRVRLAREARQWTEAQRLQRIRVDWDRQRASTALGLAPERLSPAQRNQIRTLAASVHELGEIERELGQPECLQSYNESYELAVRIDDGAGAATVAFNLGRAYEDVPAIRDLAEAERWHRRSLELRQEEDRLGRARCLGQLGIVANRRFLEAKEASRPAQELLKHLNAALGLYLQALDLTPQDAIADLATCHNQLGVIYAHAGDLERASQHHRKAISYREEAGDAYGAAQARCNVAVTLAQGVASPMPKSMLPPPCAVFKPLVTARRIRL